MRKLFWFWFFERYLIARKYSNQKVNKVIKSIGFLGLMESQSFFQCFTKMIFGYFSKISARHLKSVIVLQLFCSCQISFLKMLDMLLLFSYYPALVTFGFSYFLLVVIFVFVNVLLDVTFCDIFTLDGLVCVHAKQFIKSEYSAIARQNGIFALPVFMKAVH
ncbi:hypothetical protein T4D_14313 [Trichinella pseudospiralis]|uniref:Uncharacterized protein n=1 Tax=Trichinella pseudospiralis TaxID=6337 RepID=A0A0V1FKX3_TRIPS|nr:hypothetical protein T4D_12600 [Trichinella pseudospiralis]KRY86351.1 hypothetical protein T4D_14313 [Trichinella pseudospiralis]